MKNRLLTLALGWILLLLFCSCSTTANKRSTTSVTPLASHATPTPTPAPTVLQVIRVAPPAASLARLNTTITDASEVQALYRIALATSIIPRGSVLNCPVALSQYQGVYYHLLFFQNKHIMSQMELNASGCYTLRISADPRVHIANATFISAFLRAIGRSSLLS
jgi:hypothetical protein